MDNLAKRLDVMFEVFIRCLDAESTQRVAGFRIDPAIQARIEALAERSKQAALTTEEKAEYDTCTNAKDFFSVLKFKARRRMVELA